jgi:hypothetical protein
MRTGIGEHSGALGGPQALASFVRAGHVVYAVGFTRFSGTSVPSGWLLGNG